MFTGIIESFGAIKRIETRQEGKVLTIAVDRALDGTKIGDSIAVNGACLTVTSITGKVFTVDMAPETVDRTTFKKAVAGTRVNIERALRLSDRLDGHLVSGHIDGTGRISAISRRSNAIIVTVGVKKELASEMIEKGSVAIDGISLTINRCSDIDFEVSIIPHTADITTIGLKSAGDEVNIETDMIGKYIRKMMQTGMSANRAHSDKKDISLDLLARNGFL